MSDFGFEAHLLDGDDLASDAHPLEIARDLIATGKPRSALEVLSLHHDRLRDDPEYLFTCAEAWWMEGDTLRAQQALLGAVRLRPDDPTPLRMLGALLRELGEHDKANRVVAKAQALETSAGEESPEAATPDDDGDLIASAERQEQTTRAGLTIRQWLVASAAAAAVAALIIGIAQLTRVPEPGPETATVPETVPETVPATETETETVPATATEPESEPATETVPETVTVPEPPTDTETVPVPAPATVPVPAPATVPAPTPATVPAPVPKPATEKPAASRRRPKAERKTRAPEPVVPPEPDESTVQRELSSLSASELTRRGDALYSQGHTGLAASYYRSALDRDPDYAPALVGIGRSILRAESYDDAMENATHALEHVRGVDARPGLEAEAIYQMARVHLVRGELDAARQLFRQSISLAGTPAEAWFYLGEALWTDNSPAARAAYERYLELVPDGSLADRARRAIQ